MTRGSYANKTGTFIKAAGVFMATIAIDGDEKPTRNLRLTSLQAIEEPSTFPPSGANAAKVLPSVKNQASFPTVTKASEQATYTPSGISKEEVESLLSEIYDLEDRMSHIRKRLEELYIRADDMKVRFN